MNEIIVACSTILLRCCTRQIILTEEILVGGRGTLDIDRAPHLKSEVSASGLHDSALHSDHLHNEAEKNLLNTQSWYEDRMK